MKKHEWESLQLELDRTYAGFLSAYSRHHKADGGEAEKDMHEAIDSVLRILKITPELKDLMLGKNASQSYETYYYEDFIKPDFFKSDMPALLDKIRAKIATYI